jgi:uncharacterized membrane protein YjjB (DUF3815 family)
MKKLQVMVIVAVAALVALLPGISAARLASNHNRTRLQA